MPTRQITNEQIAEAAYHIWMAEGCPHGQDEAHWCAAEAQLSAPKKRAPRKAAAKPATKAKAPAKPRAKKAAAKTA